MGKVRYILIMSLLAAAFLAPGVASAQSRAGKGVARAIRGAQSVGRVAKPRGGIRLDRGAALNLPNLGRGLAEASGEHPGISLFRDAALQSSPRGPMPQRHGVRVPQNAGRSAYGRGSGRDYGRGYSGNYDLSALGELAQQYLPYAYGNGYGNGYPGYYDQYYDHHDEMADAYRDAAIANSIVNLVGIVASAALQDQGRAYPVSPAPAPVASGPIYENQKVLVREGRQETVEVWVPEHHDSASRVTVEGHYEVQHRWADPVYEMRQVRVR